MILQVIGRPEGYQPVGYKIEDRCYETPFSSDALKRHYEDKVLLFVPKSLLEEYQIDLRTFKSKIEQKGFIDFELEVIPSIGEYEFKDRKLSYENNFDNVVVAILLHLINRRPEKVLVDVCTGQNVYVFALIEAVRRYSTYRQLEGILQGYEFKFKIATYQPILKDVKEAKIEINDFSAKSFFFLPQTEPDKLCNSKHIEIKRKAGEIGKKYWNFKSKFRDIQNELKIAFNAIRYNTPLAFYQLLSFDANVDEIEREFSQFVSEFLEKEIPMNLGIFSGILFTVAMFKSFREFKSALNKPTIEEIDSKFSKIYKEVELDVNRIFLGREIEEIKIRAEEMKEEIKRSKSILLLDIYKKDVKEKIGSKDIKRNFFAHCGFIKEYTELIFYEDKLCIEWKKEALSNIRNWLLNP
ncbi:MAG: hypothetical protein NZ879_03165 [Archaeoglobaceae archaeon]|nr:hypothetical protein [Archaeoglobaceae archaeon]MDW8117967.1 TM1812 family CRISPR-associated protein [Archaeoglobaceae archaeon]